MSSPKVKSFATSAACAAASPVIAGCLVAGFSELARLNLSMYEASLVGAKNTRDNILPSQTPRARAWNLTGSLPPFAAQFFATPGAALDITLQTSSSLYRLALEGYVETAGSRQRQLLRRIEALGSPAPWVNRPFMFRIVRLAPLLRRLLMPCTASRTKV
ncbi:hypothetical protein M3I53_35885 [Paraburkholderia sp. CNPSo 3272]|uniref:hypothetical protein n=1 Tax=Paraburkholderia sp. CNPSo 3272 TaxID=2940931 RepID=UPI0020B6AC73|nr:hypothetical protein [Paraburkholderia sp. CNPSo 3272]MCP3728430.1 hypothetical protein [Paraburkholderia sp. CNPSo 3272]